MELFRIIRQILNHIYRRLNIKILLIILILVILCAICFGGSVSLAYTSEPFTYNNVDYIYYMPDTIVNAIQSLNLFDNPDNKYIITSDPIDSDNITFYFIFIDSTQYQPLFCNWWDNNRVPPQNHFYWLRASGTNSKITQFTCTQVTCDYNISTDTISNYTSGVVTYNNRTNYPTNWIEFKFIDNNYVLQANSQYNANEIWYISNYDVYTDWAMTDLFHSGITLPPSFVNPTITTSSSSVEDWSFNNLEIDLGSVDLYDSSDNLNSFYLDVTYSSTYNSGVYSIDLSPYIDITTKTITIPRNILLKNYVEDTFSLDFDLLVRGLGSADIYSLGTYSVTLTNTQTDVINGQTNYDVITSSVGEVNTSIQQLQSTQQQTNFYLQDFSSTNVGSNTANDFLDMGQDFMIDDDFTHVDNFFVILYNAFCENEPVSCTFTLPFVNKQVTISSDNISNFYPTSLKNVVSIIAYGGICLWIAKDLRTMLDKINTGNVENISNDIKKEVL